MSPQILIPEISDKNHRRGWIAEDQVIRHYQAQGYEVWGRRVKTPFAEVDLVFQKEKKILLVEVKSFTSFDFLPYRISRRQKSRLERAFLYFQTRHKMLGLQLAVVSQKGEVLIIPDVFS